MEHKVHRLYLSLTLILILLMPTSVSAQSGVTLEAEAGFDGYYRSGGWIPVRITVANTGADAEGEVQIASYSNWRGKVVYSRSLSLPTQSRKQFVMYVHVDSYVHNISVKLSYTVNGKARHRNAISKKVDLQPLDPQSLLCAIVSDDPASLHYLAGLPPIRQRRVYVAHMQVADLPTQAGVLSGIDVLILRDVDTGQLSTKQRDALRGWVALGGHLIVCGGAEAEITAAGLEELLPVKVEGTITTQDLSPLGTYAGVYIAADMPTVIARARPISGHTIAAGKDIVFLQRATLDKGVVDYLAVDPDQEPLRTWRGLENLWITILQDSAPAGVGSGGVQVQNLNMALTNIPNLDVPSALLVIAFLLAYVLAVGPLNFALLRLTDRRELAWVTIPVLILVFSCLAYGGGILLRGRKVIVSQVTVMRVYPHSGIADARHLVGFFSPRRRRYDIRLPGDVLVYRNPTYYGEDKGDWFIEQGEYNWLRNTNIDVGTMRSVAAHSIRPWSGVEANLTFSLVATTTAHIEGTITNHTDADLNNCFLIWNGGWATVADLPAGATRAISATLSPDSPIRSWALVPSMIKELNRQHVTKRERERREAMLSSAMDMPYYYPPTPVSFPVPQVPVPSSQNLFTEPTLLAWNTQGQLQVEVENTPTLLRATTLYLIPLTISPRDDTLVFLPRGSLQSRVTSPTGYGGTPYNLYPASGDITIEFQLPSQQVEIKRLFLHLDPNNQYGGAYGPTPEIHIQVPGKGWKKLTGLKWGSNELSEPETFRCPNDKLMVRISTTTMNEPIMLDFSLIGQRR